MRIIFCFPYISNNFGERILNKWEQILPPDAYTAHSIITLKKMGVLLVKVCVNLLLIKAKNGCIPQ